MLAWAVRATSPNSNSNSNSNSVLGSLVGLVLLGLAPACDGPVKTETVNSPVLRACAHSEGNTLKLKVGFEKNCLSSSCDTVKSASCSMSVEGDKVMVSGEAVVERITNRPCTEDCRALTAECELELPEGVYYVHVGGADASSAKERLDVMHPLSAPIGSCDLR